MASQSEIKCKVVQKHDILKHVTNLKGLVFSGGEELYGQYDSLN
jgi:hypothetical protein